MEALLLGTIGAIGYYITDKNKRNKEAENKNVITVHQKPNGENIYEVKYSDTVFGDEEKRADKQMEDSLKPAESKRIGVSLKDYPSNVMLKESEIKYLDDPFTDKKPSAASAVENTSNNLQTLEDFGSYALLDFNTKRGTLRPLQKSGSFIVDKNTDVEIYQGFDHNNMEPFYGSSIKQNMDPFATKSILERHTGANPVYFHKSEQKPLFDPHKDPYVNGMPVMMNRQDERMIVTHLKNNIKPFEEERVAPGLNLGYGSKSNIGFHDTYRPTPKTTNELRVNPKLSYQGKTFGKKHFVTNRTSEIDVESRKHVDLSYTTFAKEGMHQRDLVPNQYGSGGTKARVNDSNSIILLNTERDQYGNLIENFQGGAMDTSQGKYVAAEVRASNKPTFENNHRFVGANVKKSHIYDADNWRAKDTIKQQTQDNLHADMNVGTYKKNQVYLQDKIRTTVKEQTHVENYKGISGSGYTNKFSSRIAGMNASNNGLKEATIHGKVPVPQGAKVAIHKEGVNFENTRKLTFNTYDIQRRIGKAWTPTNGIIPKSTRQGQVYDDVNYQSQRIDPSILDQFKGNPYTKSLHSATS